METKENPEIVRWLDSLAPWEIFFTGTVKPNPMIHKDGEKGFMHISLKSLQKGYEHFMRKNYPAVSHVYVFEPFGGWSGHGFHVHAMFDAGHDIWWKNFHELWKDRFGRNSTEPIKHKADVESYVTKYMMKYHDQKDVWPNERVVKNGRLRGRPAEPQLEEIWYDVKLSKYRKHQLRHRMSENGSSGLATKVAASKRRVSDPHAVVELQEKFGFSTETAFGVA